MDNIILYTTHCSRCEVLKKKLDQKGVSYELIEGEGPILALGYNQAPLLKVNNEILNFTNAIEYINRR